MNSATFDNFPVEFNIVENDILITCKKVTGKYSQIKSYINKSCGKNYPYMFADSLIIKTTAGYKIACLNGSFQEAENILNICKNLLIKNKLK